MGVLDECLPLTARQELVSGAAIGLLAKTAATVGVGSGVPRVVQGSCSATHGQRRPAQLPLVSAGRKPRRKQQTLLAEVLDSGAHRAGAREGLEEQMHTLLDPLVGVEHHLPVGSVDEADRQRATQLAAPCLVEEAAPQTGSQHMQLRLAHRTLETQQQAVVEVGRIIDAVLIKDEGVREGADLQQPVPVGRIARQS